MSEATKRAIEEREKATRSARPEGKQARRSTARKLAAEAKEEQKS